MFAFLRKRVYRRQFIIYSISLFLACLLVCVVLLKTTINTQVERAQQEALTFFKNSESAITLNMQRIDTYFMQLYSSENAMILEDFSRFLGSSAEEYVMKRLEELDVSETDYSFIQNIKNFDENNNYSVSRVACFAAGETENGTLISFSPNGRFGISFQTETLPLPDEDLSEGIQYTKSVPDPNDSGTILGDMVFTIAQDAVFPAPSDSMIGTVAVMSKNSEMFFETEDEATKNTVRSIYEGATNHGTYGSSVLAPAYYTVFTSENYRYKLISLVRLRDIVADSPAMIFGPLVGSVFIFIFITVLLATRMSYDARHLGQITGAIDSAKGGRFTKIDLGRRDDEYSIIANELNNMSDELNRYIEKEYALKLRQKEAEMKMMQQQIHPHFLYNTLEVIRSRALMGGDAEVADAVYNLGSMFRSMVKAEDVITIEEEIGILTKYLHLMEFKYQGNFFYQIDVAPELMALSTVKFWMQPLAENFFIHGFDPENQLNLIVLKGSSFDGGVCFEMINNGLKMEEKRLEEINASLINGAPQSAGSIGLQNVYQRLYYFYGEKVRMSLSNNPESGISVSITIRFVTEK